MGEFENSKKLGNQSNRSKKKKRKGTIDRPNNRNIIANSRKPVNRWLRATTFRRNTMQFHSMDNRTTSYSSACYAIIRLKLQHRCRGRCKISRFRIHEMQFVFSAQNHVYARHIMIDDDRYRANLFFRATSYRLKNILNTWIISIFNI